MTLVGSRPGDRSAVQGKWLFSIVVASEPFSRDCFPCAMLNNLQSQGMTAKITNSEKNQNKKESKERKGTAGLALVIL